MHSAKALRLSPPETASPGCRLPVHPPTWPTKPVLRINCDTAWLAPGLLPTPPHTPARTTSPAPPSRTSPAPSRTRPTPQSRTRPTPERNQAHPSRQDRPTPDKTRPAPDTTRPAPQNRTSPALRQNQVCAPAEPGPRPQTRRHAAGSGVVPRGARRAIGEARHRRAKIRATPGGYGGKPPGVAIIGVPTGARNAGSGAPTGDQSTDMNATRKHPLVCHDPIATRSRQGG
jgi:hypothetical protein